MTTASSTSIASPGSLSLVYEGSVKHLWADPAQPEALFFQFTDEYSVFDWGKMPDTLAFKGQALALMAGLFFEYLADPVPWQQLPQVVQRWSVPVNDEWLASFLQFPVVQSLQQHGLAHHFIGFADTSGRAVFAESLKQNPDYALGLKVRRAQVTQPVRQPEGTYDYTKHQQTVQDPQQADRLHFIPLEVVFRWGMPEGSSLQKRLAEDPAYAKVLGLPSVPKPQQWFDRPVIEWFTKLEPMDRWLPESQALALSGLSPVAFESLKMTAQAVAIAIRQRFAQVGIECWDGKVEFAWHPASQTVVLVDGIGPDELRLLCEGVHLSKEILRQYYKSSLWVSALNQAKLEVPQGDWKTYCQQSLEQSPQPLRPEFKAVVDQLYPVLINHWAGFSFFDSIKTLPQFIQDLNTALKRDVISP